MSYAVGKLDGKTNEELEAMVQAIESDPVSKMPPGSLWLYTPKARKKLDLIARAITNNICKQRALNGETINNEGYSGRQSNR